MSAAGDARFATHRLGTPDALHLATALEHGCDELRTNDDRLSGAAKGIRVVGRCTGGDCAGRGPGRGRSWLISTPATGSGVDDALPTGVTVKTGC